MRWLELSVRVHAEAVDAVANVFQEHGTGGVSIEQAVVSHIEGEEEPRFTGLPTLKGYLPVTGNVEERAEAIERALWHLQAFNLSPVGAMERREIEEEDWANGWKEHFHPLKIGRVVIKPTWRAWDAAPDEVVVELDPGMAFGTGLHPTTSLMILGLQARVKPGVKVLDLGTGSGILAIAAARMGAHVTALDISEVAVEVARKNIQHNAVADSVTVDEGSIEKVAGERYDLLLANIIARVIAELALPLYEALDDEGVLLASGIIEERVGEVRSAFAAAGLKIIDETSEGDWCLITAVRKR